MRTGHVISLLSIGLLLTIASFVACSDDKPTNNGGSLPAADIDWNKATYQSANEFDRIPQAAFDSVRSKFHIFYGHTSHGSQLMTGLDLLESEYAHCDQPSVHEYGDDLGHNGDTSWVPPTRAWLAAHPECNMVIWSWCGGCSDNTREGIETYLDAMSGLESDYPDVIFVYMTGHLDGSGDRGPLAYCNSIIRNYCDSTEKVLYDFANIEQYDPDGYYYPDETDSCGWCYDWCAENDCDDCGCAHSHCFNCYRKGQAFWWLLARLSGWGDEY